MTIRTLEYQERVLGTFAMYLDRLIEHKERLQKAPTLSDTGLSAGVPAMADYPKGTWTEMQNIGMVPESRTGFEYSSKFDGCNRPVPNVVFKVPTGGGKTWLAVSALCNLFGKYIGRNSGFVLWIVPNDAIYTQTVKNFRDRQHPYRKALDRMAAGKVEIFEKNDRLSSMEMEGKLCVMVLMLQSANRDTRETLRIFKDRGDIHGFVPGEGEQDLHQALIEKVGNLEVYDYVRGIVKDSLGNALRIIRPIVVLDEGHRATTNLAYRTLYGFNPCFVLELTATPQDVVLKTSGKMREIRNANVLVEVSGLDLVREEMVKMPINLSVRMDGDWRVTLHAATRLLKKLGRCAERHKSDTDQYIRPILLVQVERTGKEQRGGGYIHALDVKDELLAAGFGEEEIAIKSADVNDLQQPENIDLLASSCSVRVIITKQALREGWDCSFAYILCSLSASRSLTAATQIVGRILRQPYAAKSDTPELNECYVITQHSSTGDVIDNVKRGLTAVGLGDLAIRTLDEDDMVFDVRTVVGRRRRFSETVVCLPKVLIEDGNHVRDLDYTTDILSNIDWRGYTAGDAIDRIPINARPAEQQVSRVTISSSETGLAVGMSPTDSSSIAFDEVYAVQMISEVVPNPFVARQIVERLVCGLSRKGFSNDRMGEVSSIIINELLADLRMKEIVAAEEVFVAGVETGKIQFKLRVDGNNWIMPVSVSSPRASDEVKLLNDLGGDIEKSLFSPVFRDDFNQEERRVAIYLDAAETVKWWHRNVARQQYGLQGWGRNVIYPDFIFEVCKDGVSAAYSVIETKGDHLVNSDTAYKRKVLRYLSDNFEWNEIASSGQLEVVRNDGVSLRCDLVLLSEIETELSGYL